MKIKYLYLFIIIILILAACGGEAQDTSQPLEESITQDVETGSQDELIPADPQLITFTASDGTELSGIYYPPANGPAPVVVFMHQVNTDQTSWRVIAAWLQNRGVSVEIGSDPWLDPTWFPAVPEALQVGVFTFTFRGCDGGCQSMDPEGWRMDALAALETAATLPNADPSRLIAVGTSIGADGAVDACYDYRAGSYGRVPGSHALFPRLLLEFPIFRGGDGDPE